MKVCTKCKEIKPWTEFSSHPKGKLGLNPRCKSCILASWREHYYERGGNLGRREYARRWIKKNKHKISAKKRKNYMDWIGFFKKEFGDNPKCEICGRSLNWVGRQGILVHFDHCNGDTHKIKLGVFRWMRGYSLTEKNIERFRNENFGILCGNCNSSLPTNLKRRKAIAEYILKGGGSCGESVY